MIQFEDVSFVHQSGVTALKDINVRIERGEVVAIVGENGAGKTTLVKHMIGLLKPAKGRVTVFGKDTREASTAELSRHVGVAFQNPDHQLFCETVEEEVSFALRNFGFSPDIAKKRVEWVLGFFGLEQYRKSPPITLSGGEKKRLTLACILAWDPDAIVLDEPTVGQDAIQKEKLSGIIRMLNSTGKTVIIVSHDIEFIWPIQPRTIVMSSGRIVGDGSASSIMRDGFLLEKARVTQPQLVRLYNSMKRRPKYPFKDVLDARRYVREVLRIRTG
jgi:energy-coupling factor transport system ATP-binding protein